MKRNTFITRLYGLLQSRKFNNCMYWQNDGSSFVISNTQSIETLILPEYFHLSKISLFYRSLSKYGFKMRTNELHQREYYNPYFQQNNRQMLCKITFQPKQNAFRIRNESQQLSEINCNLRSELCELMQQQEMLLEQLHIQEEIQSDLTTTISLLIAQIINQSDNQKSEQKTLLQSNKLLTLVFQDNSKTKTRKIPKLANRNSGRILSDIQQYGEY